MSKRIICGIYKITSPSGKIYIGQSEDIERRWRLYKGKYLMTCKSYKNAYPQHLLNSIKKYGWESHIFEVIEECQSDRLDELEMYWIIFLNTYKSPHGMNCTRGGDGVKGYEWSAEARLKQSLSHIGNKPWNTGKKLTSEHIENSVRGVKEAWKRRKESPEYYSDEQKKRRSVKRSDKAKAAYKKNWETRKQQESFHSIEEKEKRSLVAKLREQKKREKGVKKSEETLKRHSEASKKMWAEKKLAGNKFFTDEALRNMRNGIIRKMNDPFFHSDEAKQKRSEKSKKAWQKIKDTTDFYSEENILKRKEIAKNRVIKIHQYKQVINE